MTQKEGWLIPQGTSRAQPDSGLFSLCHTSSYSCFANVQFPETHFCPKARYAINIANVITKRFCRIVTTKRLCHFAPSTRRVYYYAINVIWRQFLQRASEPPIFK
ncbi:hypothetical protein VCR3J2_100004 [Vibrio coralliirubri]|nr:hypothetical protein VCR3J2_100004 [Vibrio coralliirubri]